MHTYFFTAGSSKTQLRYVGQYNSCEQNPCLFRMEANKGSWQNYFCLKETLGLKVSIFKVLLTSVEFFTLGIDVFDVENILKQNSCHVKIKLTRRSTLERSSETVNRRGEEVFWKIETTAF